MGNLYLTVGWDKKIIAGFYWNRLLVFLAIFGGMLFPSDYCYARSPNSKNKTVQSDEVSRRIEFDEAVIEGMDKAKTYSGTLTGQKNRSYEHIYNPKLNFDREMSETLSEMRFK
jgi:hypothetical protein